MPSCPPSPPSPVFALSGPFQFASCRPKAAPKPLINSRLPVVSHMRLCSIPHFPASAARIDVYCAGSPSPAYPFHRVHRPRPPPPSYPTSSTQIHRTAFTAAQIKKNNSKLQRQLTPSRRSARGKREEAPAQPALPPLRSPSPPRPPRNAPFVCACARARACIGCAQLFRPASHTYNKKAISCHTGTYLLLMASGPALQ